MNPLINILSCQICRCTLLVCVYLLENQNHTHFLSISVPHAEALQLAVLPDAADVVHFLQDSFSSAGTTKSTVSR